VATTKDIRVSTAHTACDVCGRTLLRGERAETYIDGVARRSVCELCKPRALHEGWIREGTVPSYDAGDAPSARRGSFLSRFRRRRDSASRIPEPAPEPGAPQTQAAAPQAAAPQAAAPQAAPPQAAPPQAAPPQAAPPQAAPPQATAPQATAPQATAPQAAPPQAALRPVRAPEEEPDPPPRRAASRPARPAEDEPRPRRALRRRARELIGDPGARERRNVRAVPVGAEQRIASAIGVFNNSEQRRTVAGVAKSLGAPTVSIHPNQVHQSVVQIVASWELCWYRYEVDLSDEVPVVRVAAQGHELDELPPQERQPNASYDEYGALGLLGADH
jgi:hypothetical protein